MNSNTAQSLITQNKKTYNSIAQNFSQTRNKIWPELDFFIKNYIKEGQDILDIGCGNGRLFGAISEKLNQFNYTGTDISEKLIDEASKQFINFSPRNFDVVHCQPTPQPPLSGGLHEFPPDKGGLLGNEIELEFNQCADRIKFLVSDVLNLSPDFIKENKFDAIFAIAVLNHIPSKELRKQVIKNIFELLKPNGYLLMTNWNLWNFSSSKSWWKLKYPALSNGSIKINYKLDFKDIITYWGQKKLPLYYHAFTKREIKKLLEINNFKIIKNYYSLENKEVSWRKAKNLVTIAQRQVEA